MQAARENHHASPVVTAALGRLMMGAQMMGSMLKGGDELSETPPVLSVHAADGLRVA